MRLETKLILAAVVSAVALAIFGNVMHNIEARNLAAAAQAEQAAKQKLAKERRAALIAKKPMALHQAQQLIDAGQPDAALNLLAELSQLNAPDISNLQARAKTELSIKKLSDELATKPREARAMVIYQELAALQPSNQLWALKAEEIRPLVEAGKAQQDRADAQVARQKAVQLLFSGWDGSAHVVERGIKAQLKDPDSYKHIETKYVDTGFGNVTVTTRYSARNSFNAVVPSMAAAVVTPAGELLSLTTKQ